MREGFRIKAKTGEKRMGLFGGTFNPIHLGHLRGAEEIRESFDLTEVVFIPASIPPHKKMKGVMDASHRLEMTRRAIATNPCFSVSDIELKRSGKSYSIDTIRYFKGIHPGSLYFILGEDAFLEIETWREFQSLFSLCHFIVMARPKSKEKGSFTELPAGLAPFFEEDRSKGTWTHASGNYLYWKEITLFDISSTQVRQLINREASIRYLIPTEVEAYIHEKGLYRGDGQVK